MTSDDLWNATDCDPMAAIQKALETIDVTPEPPTPAVEVALATGQAIPIAEARQFLFGDTHVILSDEFIDVLIHHPVIEKAFKAMKESNDAGVPPKDRGVRDN